MPIPYVGGKTKYASDILSVVLPGNDHRDYWEPFVGSAAMLVNIPQTMKRFANDKNPYLIAMHEAVRDGWHPPTDISEDEYQHIKRNPSKYHPSLVGFVSLGCSFGAKMWGGYARNAKGTNYAKQSSKAVLDTFTALQGVSFTCCDYQDLLISDGALVCCDPPYQGTTDYGDYKVQSTDFWRWCNKLVARRCVVFVSGYKKNKVTGWEVCWSTDVKTLINNSNDKVATWKKARIECLFRPTQQHIDHLVSGYVCECWKTTEDLERESRLVA